MAESRSPRHVRRAKGAKRAKPGSKTASGGRASQGASDAGEQKPILSGRSRLQKILAGAGLGSRRATEQLLLDARVTVNGRIARLGDSADLSVDVVALDGERLKLKSASYWLLNKPVGVVTTMKDPERRPTVAHLLPPRASGVFPVGRLDIDTSGLVLLTNDGALMQTLLHPSSGGEKEYEVVVKGEVSAASIRRLERGLVLDDGKTKPARTEAVTFDPERAVSNLRLVLTEGRIGRSAVRCWCSATR